MLCSRFGFSSVITHGKQLGRELGTPTINQSLLNDLVVPRFGVYASEVTLESGERFCGVTNVGVKPTVGGETPLWETWMPDYHGGENARSFIALHPIASVSIEHGTGICRFPDGTRRERSIQSSDDTARLITEFLDAFHIETEERIALS